MSCHWGVAAATNLGSQSADVFQPFPNYLDCDRLIIQLSNSKKITEHNIDPHLNPTTVCVPRITGLYTF
jgi:hypothetical protein